MNIEEIKSFFSKKPEILYPFEVLESGKSILAGKVFPISSSINGYNIPGLFISCNSEICDYFKIGYPPPSPNLKFRMVNIEEKDYLMEVLLLFKQNKIMRLHLNPINALVRHYLKLGIKNQIISFHFYNQDNHQLIDSITNLSEEDMDWFKRNYSLAKKLKVNLEYDQLADIIERNQMGSKRERCFKFHSTSNQNMLIEKATKYIKMTEVKSYFDKTGNK